MCHFDPQLRRNSKRADDSGINVPHVSDPDAQRSPAKIRGSEPIARDPDPDRRDSGGASRDAMREVAAGMPPEPRTFMRFAGLEHHGPRRLLNVFPDSALEPESIEDPGASPTPTPAASATSSVETQRSGTALESERTVLSGSRDTHRRTSFDRSRREPTAQTTFSIDEEQIALTEEPAVRMRVRSHAFTAALVAATFALLLVAGAGGAVWLWRDAVSRTILRWENIPVTPAPPAFDVPAAVPRIPPPD
jgi:hypothetical protein